MGNGAGEAQQHPQKRESRRARDGGLGSALGQSPGEAAGEEVESEDGGDEEELGVERAVAEAELWEERRER